MNRQFNIRLPKHTEQQIKDLCEWYGMTQTQVILLSIDRLHTSITPKGKRNENLPEDATDHPADRPETRD